MMKRLILCILLLSVAAYALGISALHVSPQDFSPGKDVDLVLEITDLDQDLTGIDIQYRAVGEKIFRSEPMRQDSPGSVFFSGIIPAAAMVNDEVEYRFEFRFRTSATVYLPADDDMTPLYVLRPRSPEGTKTDGFVLLSDEASISADDGYILAVSFIALEEDIDPQSIKVYVGGRDVTKDAKINGAVLLYRDERPQAGLQRAMVTARHDGKELYSDTWVTQILPGSGRRPFPISTRGTVNFAANIYDVSNKDAAFGAKEDDYRSWADLYASYGMLDAQVNFLVSSMESSNRQPINRFTFGLSLPIAELYLGDYSPHLSSYTLSGKNIRGLYGNLDTRYLGLMWAHGESVRKTTFESDATNVKSGTFKQEAIGARVRLGSEDGFMVGISGSRHRDIISSLDEEYYRYETAAGDTVYTSKAQDNAVISVDARLNVPDQSVIMGVELAGSLFNNNTIPGPLTSLDLEEYGLELELGDNQIDPSDFADFFVINKNMEPFVPGKANIAWTGYLRMYFWNNFLNVQYSETGPAFNALGAHYQMNDSKVLTVSDQIMIGRLMTISGSYSVTEDNLMGHKSETNNYQNINVQAILRIPRYPYLKASFSDNKGENKANESITDDFFAAYTRDSRNMSFGVGYNIVQIPHVPTQLDISYRFGNNSSEQDTGSPAGMDLISDNKNNGLALNMSNRYNNLPLRTQFSYSTASNENMLLDKTYQNNSFFFRADYSFMENIIRPYFSFRNTSMKKDYDPQSYNYYNLGMEAYPMQNMSVTADVGLRNYKNDTDSSLDYDTTTFRLIMSQRF